MIKNETLTKRNTVGEVDKTVIGKLLTSCQGSFLNPVFTAAVGRSKVRSRKSQQADLFF